MNIGKFPKEFRRVVGRGRLAMPGRGLSEKATEGEGGRDTGGSLENGRDDAAAHAGTGVRNGGNFEKLLRNR